MLNTDYGNFFSSKTWLPKIGFFVRDATDFVLHPAGSAESDQIWLRTKFPVGFPDSNVPITVVVLRCWSFLEYSNHLLNLGLKLEELNDDCDVNYIFTFSEFCLLVCFCYCNIRNAGVHNSSLIWFYAITLHLQSTVPKSGSGISSSRIWVFMNLARSGSIRIWKTGIQCIPVSCREWHL